MSAKRNTIRSRKTPVQERSQATVEAILEATIQVLTSVGAEHLTTTVIAARAGVSVGTLYQYFPNKQSVLHGVLEMHLTKVVVALERACKEVREEPVAVMAEGLVGAFVSAKMERPDASVALYAVSSNPEANALMQRLRRRSLRAMAGMLETAPDAAFVDLAATTEMLYGAMAGATRAVLEGGATPKMVRSLREQLVVLCGAYLAAAGAASVEARVSLRR
ncbi:MAG: TetR/AcrR family transcriptional regulator [Acidobacteria bacterium]|nr:TetR/AcrR family transcriptional regulator [Acidobacteriota bacterium]